jgi:hypothetical protein
VKTQEAIDIIIDDRNGSRRIDVREADEIIVLLQQGEKYRKMWGDLEEFCNGNVLELEVNDNELWKFKIKKIIQKYFPKETNQYKEEEE